jgi:hypothetical protein
MDFGSGQGANYSDTLGIARICNAAMAQKARFYVSAGVQHCAKRSERQQG